MYRWVAGEHQQNPADVRPESTGSILAASTVPQSGLNLAWIFGDAVNVTS